MNREAKAGALFAMMALSLAMLPGAATAQVLQLGISPAERIVNAGSQAIFEANLTNGLGNPDGFYFYVAGTPANWINVDTGYVEMGARSSKMLKIEFYPNDVAGIYEYEVFFQSRTKPEFIVSKKLILKVAGSKDQGVAIIGHSVTRGEDGLEIQLEALSGKENTITLDLTVSGDSGMIIASETIPFKVSGQQNLTHMVPVSRDAVAGRYVLRGFVRETGYAFNYDFEVEPVSRMVRTQDEQRTPLYDEVRITVANEGNVIEKDYSIVSNVPTGMLTFFRHPSSCEGQQCEWVLSRLNPDESVQIVYRLEYWPLILEGILIAALILTFAGYGWRKTTTPTISKKVNYSGKGVYTAVLEVKNPGARMSNVLVKDTVSPLFRLDTAFEGVRPGVRSSGEDTELVWSLPSVEKKDHRILHYSFVPVISGHLKVPEAQLRFLNQSGKKVVIRSGESFFNA